MSEASLSSSKQYFVYYHTYFLFVILGKSDQRLAELAESDAEIQISTITCYEVALDGFYKIRASLSKERMETEDAVRSDKLLTQI